MEKELILANSWSKIVEESGRDDLIFTCLEDFPNFVTWLSKQDKVYTVVAGYSDFGICEQSSNYPNRDLRKVAEKLIAPLENETKSYYKLPEIQVTTDLCRPEHRYSVKIDSFTLCTFNAEHLPSNVKRWHCVNLNCSIPGFSLLPFGMNEQGHGKDLIRRSFKRPEEKKSRLLYVNFQNHTRDRVSAKRYFSKEKHAYVVDTTTLNYREFCKDLSECPFVLAMPGNGFDCYRTYEATWAGCIIVAPEIPLYQNLQLHGFPVVTFKSFTDITPEFLEKALEFHEDFDWENEIFFLDYWRREILS